MGWDTGLWLSLRLPQEAGARGRVAGRKKRLGKTKIEDSAVGQSSFRCYETLRQVRSLGHMVHWYGVQGRLIKSSHQHRY